MPYRGQSKSTSCKPLKVLLTYLVSKLVTGETQDHQPMGELALKLVKLTEVPGGCASQRGHILNKDHSSPIHVKVHSVSLQSDGS